MPGVIIIKIIGYYFIRKNLKGNKLLEKKDFRL